MTVAAGEMLPKLVERIIILSPQWRFRYATDIAELAMLVFEISIVTRTQSMPEWFSVIVHDNSLSAPAKLYQLIGRWEVLLGATSPRPADGALRGMP